ncbi:phosphatase PAP2 family protein [Nocardioides sp. GCM10027113]|uniref:phosphatase PAP2 family protein n=1 Tax=unclassified Nocardioides TaxID=2615069 RepID=UPI003617E10F
MTLLDTPRTPLPPPRPRLAGGLRELALVALLYVGYSASRLVADDAPGPAVARAMDLVAVEQVLGIAWEGPLTALFVDVGLLGLLASFQYATAHYVVTAGVLLWLHRRGPAAYLPARRALVLATVAGLVVYLLVPMAPPRLTPGWSVDVLQLHASAGWWGAEASAPRGLGGLTNQLAAFPSLHAGWALWVALAVRATTTSRVARSLGWAHAAVTAVVVVGTGNHWVLDVVAGWLVVLLGYAVAGWRAGDLGVNSPPGVPRGRHAGGRASLPRP